MKRLIVTILLSCLNCLADPVSFTWRPNTEENLAGYVLYLAPSVGTVAEEMIFTTNTRITVDRPPGFVAWLTARNTAGYESDPTYPLIYNPIIVELVLQGTKDIPDWVDINRRELFRAPDAIFDPARANIPQTLRITKTEVIVSTPSGDFHYPQDSTLGKKFFRSYVAARPL